MELLISGVSSRPAVRGHYAPILSALPAGRSIAVRVLNRGSCSTNQVGVSPIFRWNQSVKSSRQKAKIYQKSCLRYCASLTSGHPSEPEPGARTKNYLKALPTSLDAFYRFSRALTMIGTAIGIISVSLLTVESMSDLSPLFFTGLLKAAILDFVLSIRRSMMNLSIQNPALRIEMLRNDHEA